MAVELAGLLRLLLRVLLFLPRRLSAAIKLTWNVHAARERAEEHLGEASSGEIDVTRAQIALARAVNRLRVSGQI